jgi:hypothetical protein
LKHQLADQKGKNQKLDSEQEVLSTELSVINNEKMALSKKCDYLEKLVEDTRDMTREDDLSF